MNFVAHACIGVRAGLSSDEAFASMTPDLMHLAQAPAPPEFGHFGVDAHRFLDRIFHVHPCFLEWQQLVVGRMDPSLRHLGRAVAHVAIEFAIDGVLLKSIEDCDNYLATLNEVQTQVTGAWRSVVDRLLADDPTRYYRSSIGIATRTSSVPERRLPGRVAIDAEQFADVMSQLTNRISPVLPGLFEELTHDLRLWALSSAAKQD